MSKQPSDWLRGPDGQRAINHVFMPRQLPGSIDKEEDDHPELCLYAILECAQNILPPATLGMLSTWAELQRSSLDIHSVKKAIVELKPGAKLAFYLVAQNATITIKKQPDQETVKIWGFDVNAKSSTVTSSPGTLYGLFPRAAMRVPARELTESFVFQIVALHGERFPDALSMSRKHGIELEETRDTVDPKYFFDWFLSAVSVEGQPDNDVQLVKKKVRDVVAYKSANKPWRRSGMYLSLKWVLHTALVEELGTFAGTCIYKACMLKLVCALASEQFRDSDIDLRQQMLIKCSQKLSKMEVLVPKEILDEKSSYYCETAMENAREVTRTIAQFSARQWSQYAVTWDEKSKCQLNPEEMDFANDIKHRLPNSKSVLLEMFNRKPGVPGTFGYKPTPTYSMTWNNSDDNQLWILHQTEEEAFQMLAMYTTGRLGSVTVVDLSKKFQTYIRRANDFYKDPFGWSRMFLCAYCQVATIHRLICQKYPLLKEHSSSVDVSYLKHLVIVDTKQLAILKEVEEYFVRFNRAAKYPGPLDSEVSANTLSVRFARNNLSMENTRAAILKESAKLELRKREEIRRLKIELQELEKKIRKLEHDYRYSEYSCDHCHINTIGRQIDRMSAALFEHLLPEKLNYQRAIVFELTVSDDVTSWREAVVLLNERVQQLGYDYSTYFLWQTEARLESWGTTPVGVVKLGSKVKSFLQTHYRSRKILHSTEDDFIVPNAGNCVYNVSAAAIDHERVRKMCTFSLEQDSYKPLQSFMGFVHQESAVLAAQHSCSQKMSLSEFVTFGNLRAGQRIQWHNIYAALHQRAISFGEKGVMQLICQAINQTCETSDAFPSPCNRWMRNAHASLLSVGFVQEMVDELNSYLNAVEKNWENHWALGSVVVLATRLYDIVGTVHLESADPIPVQDQLAVFLRRCRALGLEWIRIIEGLLKETDKINLDDLAALRRKLVEIALIVGLSYNVQPKLRSQILNSNSDMLSWLKAVIYIHGNTALTNEPLSGFSASLLQLVHRIAFQIWIPLRDLAIPEVFERCVTDYYTSGYIADSTFIVQDQQALWVQFDWVANVDASKSAVQINLLRGDFWFNGQPLGKLAAEVTRNQLFIRLFQATVFDVVECTDALGLPARRTKYEYSGSRFVFCQDGSLRICEERVDGQLLYLVPDTCFKADFPQTFSEDYSHWLCITTKKLYFRPRSFKDPRFSDLSQVEFVLDCSTYVLTNAEGQSLIDIHSPTTVHILNVFKRLELLPFIHCWHHPPSSGKQPVVRLTRHGLDFRICLASGLLSSVEHVGWDVSPDQSVGTLFGLQQGLTLEARANPLKKCLLIPHGSLQFSRSSSSSLHHQVDVDLNSLLDPSYFSYKIDSRLRCLTGAANQNASLYLAALHAATSGVLRDPFTGMTGLEMAFHILQSPRCWSSRPYDKTAYNILRFIAQLAPKRKYYPEHVKAMLGVDFPSIIPSLCAHDGYYFLSKKLWDDSNRLSFLYSCSMKQVFTTRDDDGSSIHALHAKFYHASCASYSPLARLGASFQPAIGGTSFAYPTEWEPNSRLRYIATVVQAGGNIEDEFTADNLWSALVDDFDPPTNRYQVQKLPDDMISCASWKDILVPETFFALESHLRNNAYPPWHRSFLITFLAFCSANPQLLSALTLLSREDVHVQYPQLLSYCTKMPSLVGSSYFQAIEFEEYKSKQNKVQKNMLRDPSLEELEYEYESKLQLAKAAINRLFIQEKQIWESKLPPDFFAGEYKMSLCMKESYDVLYKDFVNDSAIEAFRDAYQFKMLEHYCHLVQQAMQMTTSTCMSSVSEFCESLRPMLHIRSDLPKVPVSITLTENAQQEVRKVKEKSTCSIKALPISLPNSGPISVAFLKNLQESFAFLEQENGDLPVTRRDGPTPMSSTETSLKAYEEKFNQFWFMLEEGYSHALAVPGLEPLTVSGLINPCLPLTMLPKLLELDSNSDVLRNLLQAIGILWTEIQKCNRILQYHKEGKSDALRKELSHELHANWSPDTYPEWLLFEIENDVNIRPIQVKVAERMMQPSGEHHIVMQLNMGEGKTSVITPIIAAKLAKGKKLVRVVVLNSLFSMNLEELVSKLGGLLGKRVYTLRCRRDIKFELEEANTVQAVLNECQQNCGVMLTVPEHILSFRLKYLETSMKKNINVAAALGKTLTFLDRFVRDVIDEADEVLHHQYQIMYTLGAQTLPDGGHYRYVVAQATLHLVKKHFQNFQNKFALHVVGCDSTQDPQTQAFPAFRLLEKDGLPNAYKWLCERIIDDFIMGNASTELPWRSLTPNQEKVLRRFILVENLNQTLCDDFKALKLTPAMETMCLILRGLLAYEVLLSALKKRWRVEYGVDPNGPHSMAVPFRAKDTAAERTEFGHVDLAVCLTQLSYYYSGLTDGQIEQVLTRLMALETREGIYNQWVEAAGRGCLDPSIRELGGVNRSDSMQKRSYVYPFMRYHMHCLDFFLANIVFPRELVQFPSKIVATAWDLCHENRSHPVTGFSGTNDTQYMLPSFIRQHDLAELMGTNAKVCSYILLPENNTYEALPKSCRGSDLIESLAKFPRATVLIDAGALILELSNKQVAEQWLGRREDMSAAVYFNENNQICVIDRRGCISKLQLSPFLNNLDKCLVYLDDVHTRGTDLKFSAGTEAAVTLGKGLRKDKFVQACMRMRQLGFSHTLSFWASAEVDIKIREHAGVGCQVTSKHVLEWCILNSINSTREGFLSWACQGTSHLRLREVLAQAVGSASTDIYPTTNDAIAQLGANCAEKDQRTLIESFAQVRNMEKVPDIVAGWVSNLSHGELIVNKCKEFVPDEERYAHILDEQQERELEHELEEERELERPAAAEAVEETLTPGLLDVVRRVKSRLPENLFPRLIESLRDTKLGIGEQNLTMFVAWDTRLLCTRTFTQVIHSNMNHNHNDFLRPVRWIVVTKDHENNILKVIAISPFEADQVAAYMRSSGSHNSVSVRLFNARQQINENSLVTRDNLALNPGPTAPLSLASNGMLHMQLAVFAGETFFGQSEEEVQRNQALISKFLGLCPKPHSEQEERALELGRMSQDMFLDPNWRTTEDFGFSSSPVKWISDLYGLRGVSAKLRFSPMGQILLLGVLPSRNGTKLLTVRN